MKPTDEKVCKVVLRRNEAGVFVTDDDDGSNTRDCAYIPHQSASVIEITIRPQKTKRERKLDAICESLQEASRSRTYEDLKCESVRLAKRLEHIDKETE